MALSERFQQLAKQTQETRKRVAAIKLRDTIDRARLRAIKGGLTADEAYTVIAQMVGLQQLKEELVEREVAIRKLQC